MQPNEETRAKQLDAWCDLGEFCERLRRPRLALGVNDSGWRQCWPTSSTGSCTNSTWPSCRVAAVQQRALGRGEADADRRGAVEQSPEAILPRAAAHTTQRRRHSTRLRRATSAAYRGPTPRRRGTLVNEKRAGTRVRILPQRATQLTNAPGVSRAVGADHLRLAVDRGLTNTVCVLQPREGEDAVGSGALQPMGGIRSSARGCPSPRAALHGIDEAVPARPRILQVRARRS